MLFSHPNLNPAVCAAAELATDGKITDAILRDVAIMGALPLFTVRAPIAAPSALTLAERAVVSAEAAVAQARRAFDGARRRLGEANRRVAPPLWSGGQPRPIALATVRAAQADAMRFLNDRRPLARHLRGGGGRLPGAAPRLALTPSRPGG